jgi:hypothetical protein
MAMHLKLSADEIGTMLQLRRLPPDAAKPMRNSMFKAIKIRQGLPLDTRLRVDLDDEKNAMYGVVICSGTGLPIEIPDPDAPKAAITGGVRKMPVDKARNILRSHMNAAAPSPDMHMGDDKVAVIDGFVYFTER